MTTRKAIRASISVLLPGLLMGMLLPVWAASSTESEDYKNRPLDVRVERLERLMSSQKQLELLYRMKQLQEENQQLRSLLEEQGHEIHQLNQKVRELYTDMNRRLSLMEGGDPSSPVEHSVTTAGTPISSDAPAAKAAEVIDKSTVKPPIYGVTEREVVVVDGQAAQPAAQSKPLVTPIKPMTAKEKEAEQKAYQQAYDELTDKQYNKARDSFIALIQNYPNGRYAHIAQYWIAESSYAQQNYQQAIEDYQRLVDVYPFSPKKAEAELKKAYSHYELNDKENTRKTLNQLLITYPDTTEAGQARRLLKKL